MADKVMTAEEQEQFEFAQWKAKKSQKKIEAPAKREAKQAIKETYASEFAAAAKPMKDFWAAHKEEMKTIKDAKLAAIRETKGTGKGGRRS